MIHNRETSTIARAISDSVTDIKGEMQKIQFRWCLFDGSERAKSLITQFKATATAAAASE